MVNPSDLKSIALISNQKSRRNKKGALAKLSAIAKDHDIPHETFNSPATIPAALTALAAHSPDVLVINGGDGTVDMVITALQSSSAFKTMPALALIKGGTTNMTHGDIGLSPSPAVAFKRLCRGWRPAVKKRSPLIIDRNDKPPLYGFFFGANAIPRAIEKTRKDYHKKGLTGALGQALSVGQIFFGRHQDNILSPVPINWVADEGPAQDSRVKLLTLTTLKKLILNIRPKNGEDGKAALFMADNALQKNAHIIKAMYGNKTYPGIKKSAVKHLQLQGGFSWTLDGELYKTKGPDDILTIKLGDPLFFLSDKAL